MLHKYIREGAKVRLLDPILGERVVTVLSVIGPVGMPLAYVKFKNGVTTIVSTNFIRKLRS